MNSERKNYLMKEFRTIFLISSIWVIRYAKKGQFSILAVIQNIWDLYKFVLLIWIHNAKLPHERISGNFSDFINLVIRSGYAKKDHFSILAVIQIYGIYINLGCRLNSQCRNYPMKEFRAIFMISSILVIMRKKVISQY